MKRFKLSRPKDHRTSLVKNLVTSLIVYERVQTTPAKAKLAQRYIEKLLQRIKNLDAVNGYRLALASLHDQKAALKMVEVVKDRFAVTRGGATRIIKIGPRKGDNAPVVILELTIKTEQVAKVIPKDTATPNKESNTPTKTKSSKKLAEKVKK